MHRALPLAAFVVFFGQRSSRWKSRESSKILYGGSAGALRGVAGSDFDADNRRALLAELDEEDGPEGREYEHDQDASSTSGGSGGHHYKHLDRARGMERESVGSMESYETTSSSHTVYRTTATTSEFSSAFYPSYSASRRGGGGGRPSESMGYFGGSVIVNALMWPIGSSFNPHRSSSVGSVSGTGPFRADSIVSTGSGVPEGTERTASENSPSPPFTSQQNTSDEGHSIV